MTGTATSATDPATTDPITEPPATIPKPTETVEFWKAQARENEKRAKANADAADKLATLEESQKTEAQKLADRTTAAEMAVLEAKADALRWRTAAKYGISDEDAELFLTGTDEATLIKQAERLGVRVADRKKNGNHVPKEGATHTPTKPDELREFTRNLFGVADD